MFDFIKKDTKNPEIDPKALADFLQNLIRDVQENRNLIAGLQMDRDIIIKALKIQKKFDVLAAQANRKLQEEQKKNIAQKQVTANEKSNSGPAINN